MVYVNPREEQANSPVCYVWCGKEVRSPDFGARKVWVRLPVLQFPTVLSWTCHFISVIGWVMAPKGVHILTPGICE